MKTSTNTVRRQLPWMADLRVGDVIQKGTAPPRVVRQLSRYKNGDLSSVTLAIRRCSWTGRSYTVMGYSDLITMGYEKVAGIHVRLEKESDLELLENIEDSKCRTLSCCDVRGWP